MSFAAKYLGYRLAPLKEKEHSPFFSCPLSSQLIIFFQESNVWRFAGVSGIVSTDKLSFGHLKTVFCDMGFCKCTSRRLEPVTGLPPPGLTPQRCCFRCVPVIFGLPPPWFTISTPRFYEMLSH